MSATIPFLLFNFLDRERIICKKCFLSFLASSSLARCPVHLKLSESASCLPLLSQLLLEMLFLRNGEWGRKVNKTHMEPTCRLKTYLGRLAFNGMFCRPLYNLGYDFPLFMLYVQCTMYTNWLYLSTLYSFAEQGPGGKRVEMKWRHLIWAAFQNQYCNIIFLLPTERFLTQGFIFRYRVAKCDQNHIIVCRKSATYFFSCIRAAL